MSLIPAVTTAFGAFSAATSKATAVKVGSIDSAKNLGIDNGTDKDCFVGIAARGAAASTAVFLDVVRTTKFKEFPLAEKNYFLTGDVFVWFGAVAPGSGDVTMGGLFSGTGLAT